jgi:hypothetical protein
MMNPDPNISLAIISSIVIVSIKKMGFDVSETLPLSTLNGRERNTDVAEAFLGFSTTRRVITTDVSAII